MSIREISFVWLERATRRWQPKTKGFRAGDRFFFVSSGAGLGETPERGTIAALVALGGLVGGEEKLVGALATLALAFGNKIALTADFVSIETTCASALPKNYKFSGTP